MKCLITGHRLFKLETYSIDWIKYAIDSAVLDNLNLISYGLSGMASGVDLWFCQTCLNLNIPYTSCIPFEDQSNTMSKDEQTVRQHLIDKANIVKMCKNSHMVEISDMGIVVWDGNKGGTHNVVQQLIEHKKPFIWLNPVSCKTYNII